MEQFPRYLLRVDGRIVKAICSDRQLDRGEKLKIMRVFAEENLISIHEITMEVVYKSGRRGA